VISRKLFIEAIEAGIAVAQHDLSADDREALREVGRTAYAFGTNFSSTPGCPATLAGLCDPDADIKAGAWRFAREFDRCIAHNNPDGYRIFDRETVAVF